MPPFRRYLEEFPKLTQKEARFAKAILEIEKAKLPSQNGYISISPQQKELIYTEFAKEEIELRDTKRYGDNELEAIHITPEEITEYLELHNIKVEPIPGDIIIERTPRSTKKILRRLPTPRHPPMVTGKDLASGEDLWKEEEN